MNIIVTGATGFIGRNLALRLKRQGHSVVATGRRLETGRLLKQAGIRFTPAELTQAGDVEQACEPADCLVHCAAKAGDWGGYAAFYAANVLGSRNVAAACMRHGIRRLVLLSTPSVYSSDTPRLDIRESDPLPARQLTAYAKTKLAAEHELLALKGRGLRTIVLRPRAVYGVHDDTILPRILRMARRRRLPLLGGGHALADVTYIENLLDAVECCLGARDEAWNEVYNISNGDPLEIREWFRLLLAAAGKPFKPQSIPLPLARGLARIAEIAAALPGGPAEPLLTRFSVAYMSQSMTLCIDKARRLLGYVPRFTTRASLEHFQQLLACDQTASQYLAALA